jgi:ComF family protein
MKISLWQRLLDLLAPRLCVVCGRRLSPTEQVLCGGCHLKLPRTGFHRQPTDNIMARLFWGIIPVERVAALFYYEGNSPTTNILYDLKYHNRPEIGVVMGRLMAREFIETDFFSGIDLIIPVPLARSRQHHRGYNQSMELARGISQATGLPIYNKVVRRSHFVKSQTQMGRQERQENVATVFQVKDLDAICGRHVLLVDDVVTTGATMTACARELLKAEDITISIVALGFAKSK